jgi:hypothetical protein
MAQLCAVPSELDELDHARTCHAESASNLLWRNSEAHDQRHRSLGRVINDEVVADAAI